MKNKLNNILASILLLCSINLSYGQLDITDVVARFANPRPTATPSTVTDFNADYDSFAYFFTGINTSGLISGLQTGVIFIGSPNQIIAVPIAGETATATLGQFIWVNGNTIPGTSQLKTDFELLFRMTSSYFPFTTKFTFDGPILDGNNNLFKIKPFESGQLVVTGIYYNFQIHLVDNNNNDINSFHLAEDGITSNTLVVTFERYDPPTGGGGGEERRVSAVPESANFGYIAAFLLFGSLIRRLICRFTDLKTK